MKSVKWNGKVIGAPGVFSDVPMAAYHGALCIGPSVSSSVLRTLIRRSPAHAYAEHYLNPHREEPEEKEHFVIGRATHHLLLGQPFFAQEFVIRPTEFPDRVTGILKPWHSNRLECAAWLREQEKAGKTVLKGEMVETIKGMATSLGQHTLVRAGILNGQVERSIVWRDKESGLWIKCRPDAIPTDSGDFADLKTTTSVDWLDLCRTYDGYGYHMQAALLRMACREVLDIPFSSFTLLFVEKKAPFCVRDVRVKDADLDLGERQVRYALNIFAGCLKTKRWPGPGDGREGSEYIELSERARERAVQKLELGV